MNLRGLLLAGAAAAASTAAPAAAQNVYFGNLHAHTSYSDGRGTPGDAYAAARAAGMDFLAVTEHNHSAADGKGEARDGLLIATKAELYSGTSTSLVEAAAAHDRPGSFAALHGQEFSTISSGNHINVFDVPAVITVADGRFDELVEWAAATRDSSGSAPLMQMNHPEDPRREPKHYGRDDFPNDAAWVAAIDPLVELVEVLNAPALKPGTGFRSRRSESHYLRYLDLGFHVAPSAGHDNHYPNWGTSTDSRVAVVADELSKASVIAALRSRHAYATEDKNLRIVYRANGALGGDIVAAPAAGSPLELDVSIVDDDEPDARYKIEVLSDRPGDGAIAKVAARFQLQGDRRTPVRLPDLSFGRPGEYVLLRVTQTNAPGGATTDRAWTAPVWFE